MSISFPTLLLVLTPIFDLVRLITGDIVWSEIAFLLAFAGAIAGALVALPALIDWLALPRQSPAWRAAGLQLGLLTAAVSVSATSAVIRLHAGATTFAALPFALVLGSVALLLVGGWLGADGHAAVSPAPARRVTSLRVPPSRPHHA
jgi:uncharacterized membrane protein